MFSRDYNYQPLCHNCSRPLVRQGSVIFTYKCPSCETEAKEYFYRMQEYLNKKDEKEAAHTIKTDSNDDLIETLVEALATCKSVSVPVSADLRINAVSQKFNAQLVTEALALAKARGYGGEG